MEKLSAGSPPLAGGAVLRGLAGRRLHSGGYLLNHQSALSELSLPPPWQILFGVLDVYPVWLRWPMASSVVVHPHLRMQKYGRGLTSSLVIEREVDKGQVLGQVCKRKGRSTTLGTLF